MSYAGQLISTTRSGGRILRARTRTTRARGKYVPSKRDFSGSFAAVLHRWQTETAMYSDPDQITQHPSFQALVQNAVVAAPLILNELRKGPSLLVWVLDDAFPGERPYPDNVIGNITAMTNAWIAWGEQHGRVL